MAKERAIDKAKAYREQFREDMRQRSEPHVPALSGTISHPLKRYVYLGVKAGETLRQQRKAVWDLWKNLDSLKGESKSPALMGPEWCLVLPTGEMFYDYCVVRLAFRDWETEEQMVPVVEFGASALRTWASSTGGRFAMIERGSVFACDDGRRIPLAACSYRLLTDADFAPAKRTRRPGQKTTRS
jgi:hypothetical protein